jgi:D-inositol-3-phosphate glycosyltransferase
MDAQFDRGLPSPGRLTDLTVQGGIDPIEVALLDGCGDRPYVFGLTMSLMSNGVALDVVGSDEVDCPEFHCKPGVNFRRLRGTEQPDLSFISKALRVAAYYVKLIVYAATAHPRVFHILWNNRVEWFDRTLLMLYYKLLRKKIVFTAHNVNVDKRDHKDTGLNRLTLAIQYRLAERIFVHTDKMKTELTDDFGIRASRVTVIPFGINNFAPNTQLTPGEAKQRLGIGQRDKTILFFGRIKPYKGLEHLIAAFRLALAKRDGYRLLIAGRPDRCEEYWCAIREGLHEDVQRGRVLLRAEFIPDEETEVYFKAADVLVLPYRDIYQSGVLFLGQSFGLPVLTADVGSLKDDIVQGKTGFVFRPEDPDDLARTIEQYFASDLYADLDRRRPRIRDYAAERHSWDVVAELTMSVYAGLLRIPLPGKR